MFTNHAHFPPDRVSLLKGADNQLVSVQQESNGKPALTQLMADLESRNLTNMASDQHNNEQSFQISEGRSTDRTASVVYFNFVRPCAAEFLATMLFVFVGVCGSGPSALYAGFSHALTLSVLIAATASVSGGHINPAVTLGMLICRGIKPILAPFYVLSQLLGGIVGAALSKAVLPTKVYDALKGGAHMLGNDVDPGQAILAELLATSILVLTVLMVAYDDRGKSVLAPFAIGLSVGGSILAIWYISGASLNPARSFGPALVANEWKKHYVYWVGPALGSLLASIIYRFVLATPRNLWVLLEEPLE